MKLIKTKIVTLVIMSVLSFEVSANSSKGIKLNNDAVALLKESIVDLQKKAQSKNQLGDVKNKIDQAVDSNKDVNFFTKFILKYFIKKKIEDGSQEEPKSEKQLEGESNLKKAQEAEAKRLKEAGANGPNTDLSSGEFIVGQSEKEKEKNNIDQDLVFKAYRKTLEATVENQESSEVRMNLGLAFELSGDLDKAFKAYNMADKFSNGNPTLSFLAKYNMGRVLGVQKKVPEALEKYQAALDINPESKEVKVNIELLMKQQQGGGGGGDKDKKDDEGKDKEPKPDAPVKENPKNSEYKSEKLSKKNVEKILEELKNQEQKIREKEYNKGVKEKPRGKEW